MHTFPPAIPLSFPNYLLESTSGGCGGLIGQWMRDGWHHHHHYQNTSNFGPSTHYTQHTRVCKIFIHFEKIFVEK
jgi:hypothetical protein